MGVWGAGMFGGGRQVEANSPFKARIFFTFPSVRQVPSSMRQLPRPMRQVPGSLRQGLKRLRLVPSPLRRVRRSLRRSQTLSGRYLCRLRRVPSPMRLVGDSMRRLSRPLRLVRNRLRQPQTALDPAHALPHPPNRASDFPRPWRNVRPPGRASPLTAAVPWCEATGCPPSCDMFSQGWKGY